MLKIEHLTKQFGDFKAVDDLSLEVKSGQICAFIGHNGAGKTTTLKSIAGIIPFEGGEIYVDGESVLGHGGKVFANESHSLCLCSSGNCHCDFDCFDGCD